MLAATVSVVMVKVPVLAPAGSESGAGTVAAAVFELVSVTAAPAGGAAPVSVNVPVEGLPPMTLVGLRTSEERAAAPTVSVAVFVTPPYMDVMVTAVDDATPVVVMVAGADVEPAGIVTLAGSEATVVFELERVTTAPPVGAGPFSVTVAVELFPPTGFGGLRARARRVGTAVTVNAADFVTPR